MASPTLYEALGLTPDASMQMIKTAYHRLSLELHPDRNAGDVEKERQFKLVVEAYNTLIDPESRNLYDAQLGASSRYAAPVQGEVDLDDMTYDSGDDCYRHPCRCGQLFQVTTQQLEEGYDHIGCPGCSFTYHVQYEEAASDNEAEG